jgi:hypothetical protein
VKKVLKFGCLGILGLIALLVVVVAIAPKPSKPEATKTAPIIAVKTQNLAVLDPTATEAPATEVALPTVTPVPPAEPTPMSLGDVSDPLPVFGAEPIAPAVEDAPAPMAQDAGSCDPSYPDVCIPPVSVAGDLDCKDVPQLARFRVLPPDPHGFDREGDGIGCETN